MLVNLGTVLCRIKISYGNSDSTFVTEAIISYVSFTGLLI